MGEPTLISSALNFSNNNHISPLPPKKPPRKSSSEYVESDDEEITGQIYGKAIPVNAYPLCSNPSQTMTAAAKIADVFHIGGQSSAGDLKDQIVLGDDDTGSLMIADDDIPASPNNDTPASPTDPVEIKDRKLALEKSITWLRQELVRKFACLFLLFVPLN